MVHYVVKSILGRYPSSSLPSYGDSNSDRQFKTQKYQPQTSHWLIIFSCFLGFQHVLCRLVPYSLVKSFSEWSMINGKQWPTYQQFDGWESVPISCYQPANCILLNASENLPARSSSMLSPPQITGFLHHGTWKVKNIFWWTMLTLGVPFSTAFALNWNSPAASNGGGVLPWWESKGNPSNASPPQKKNALLRGYQPWLAFNNPSNMAFSSWWWNNPLANWIISPRNGGQKKFQKLFWSENNLVTCVAEGYPYLEDHPI